MLLLLLGMHYFVHDKCQELCDVAMVNGFDKGVSMLVRDARKVRHKEDIKLSRLRLTDRERGHMYLTTDMQEAEAG